MINGSGLDWGRTMILDLCMLIAKVVIGGGKTDSRSVPTNTKGYD